MISNEYLKFMLDNIFSAESIKDNLKNYHKSLRQVFQQQGDLVLYPNGEVTCFKYKNNTYFNPNFEKLAQNKIEINLRHLHPSLIPKMNQLEQDFNEIGLNRRRMEAYLKRVANFYSIHCHEFIISANLHDYSQHALNYFAYLAVPDCFIVNNNYYHEVFNDCKISLEKNGNISNFSNLLDNFYRQKVLELHNVEEATISTFKQFMFKVNILGM
jgi:hypothetical protein